MNSTECTITLASQDCYVKCKVIQIDRDRDREIDIYKMQNTFLKSSSAFLEHRGKSVIHFFFPFFLSFFFYFLSAYQCGNVKCLTEIILILIYGHISPQQEFKECSQETSTLRQWTPSP